MDADYPDGMMAEIRQFFATDHKQIMSRAQVIPFGTRAVKDEVFKSNTFFPLQRKAEMEKMLQIAAATMPKVVMEIGADKGGGLYHWCLLPTVTHVIACEIRELPYRVEFETAFPHIRFLWLPQSSYHRKTYDDVVAFLSDKPVVDEETEEPTIDVLFIDGDKGAMRDDFDMYSPLVRTGGVIFVHDVSDDVPGKAFTELQRGRKTEVILDRSEGLEAAQRADRGEKPTCAHDAWLMHWKGYSCGVGVVYV